MWVKKTDANGNDVLDANGKPILIEIPDGAEGQSLLTADEVEKRTKEASNKAAYDAKKGLEKTLKEERDARAALEASLAERDKKDKDRERAALPPDQQVLSRMSDLEAENARTRAQLAKVQEESAAQVRQIGLVAYRERAIRDVPAEVAHLVFGQSEEDIDQSVDHANKTYADLEAKFAQKYQGGVVPLQQQQQQYPQPYHHVGQPVQYQAQPPMNPAYVPPVHPQLVAQGGFPTPTNPVQIPDTQPEVDLQQMTTEQAVRSGRYGGEMRERIHASLRGNMKYPGSLGSAPRHWAQPQPANHIPQPDGVMQPQGYPTGPVQNPQMQYQQPVQPVAPQAPQGPRAAALEAANRMHQGGNTILGANVGAQEALQAAQHHAHQRGIQSPQQAFNGRFQPTPPITQ